MFLNCHSCFSFHYGLMRPEALLEEAQKAGVRTLALTDIHNTAGVSDLVRLAERYGVTPVVGIEFRSGARLLYIGIARNNDGFQQLNELLSAHLLDGEALPERPPELPDVYFILPFSTRPRALHANERIGIRPSELTRLPFSPWAKRTADLVALLSVTFRDKRDVNTHRLLRTVAKNTLVSLLPAEELAAPDDCFRKEASVRDLYRDAPQLVRNAERLLGTCSIHFDDSDKTRKVFGESEALDRERLRTDAWAGMHRRYGKPSATVLARLERELGVIDRMGFISYFLINQDIVRFARHKGFFHVGRGSGANSLVAYCLGITDVDPVELDLYFERFISTARKKPPDFDIDFSWKDRDEVYRYVFDKYNGVGIGAIHTAQIATYTTFQWRGAIRELGKAVGLPPEEIDRLSEGDQGHYGRGRPSASAHAGDLDKVAQAVVRYGKQLIGLPHHFGIHAGGILVSELPLTRYSALHRPPKGFPVTQYSMLEAEDLGLHKFDILSQRGLGHIRDAVELVNEGAVVSCQLPVVGRGGSSLVDVDDLVGCQLPVVRSDGRSFTEAVPRQPITQQVGSLTTDDQQLTTTVDIHDIPRFKNDPKIKELLRTGNTIGCFYVESPAMRMLLKKLKVEDYLALVAASSIIRPGVAESGMMREYLLRHNDPKRIEQAPAELVRIMSDTYGVMVYQEDVLKVAHHYAGLDLEEADLLRRGMTARFRERPEFKVVERKFFDNCRAKGHPDAEAAEVWRQIESFASFSFAKGHSASYAVESYQSLYLKAYHPLEFMVAVANNFGGFYHTEFYLHEAKRAGAAVEAPCVNRSRELCTLVRSEDRTIGRSENASADPQLAHSSTCHTIFLGLGNIKSINGEVMQLILHERRRNGPYLDLQDLLRRVPLPVEQARILIRVGALRFTGKDKPALLWELTLLHRPAKSSAVGDLFIAKVDEPRLPELVQFPLADAYDELELLGFPLCDPFLLVEMRSDDGKSGVRMHLPVLDRAGRVMGKVRDKATTVERAPHPATNNEEPTTLSARDMPAHKGQRVTMLGYMIHVKTTTTSSGSYMSFGSFIDPAGDFWDSTQFPRVAEQYPFRGRGVYLLTGHVEEEFGHYSLRTERMEKLPWKVDPRYGA